MCFSSHQNNSTFKWIPTPHSTNIDSQKPGGAFLFHNLTKRKNFKQIYIYIYIPLGFLYLEIHKGEKTRLDFWEDSIQLSHMI